MEPCQRMQISDGNGIPIDAVVNATKSSGLNHPDRIKDFLIQAQNYQ